MGGGEALRLKLLLREGGPRIMPLRMLAATWATEEVRPADRGVAGQEGGLSAGSAGRKHAAVPRERKGENSGRCSKRQLQRAGEKRSSHRYGGACFPAERLLAAACRLEQES